MDRTSAHDPSKFKEIPLPKWGDDESIKKLNQFYILEALDGM